MVKKTSKLIALALMASTAVFVALAQPALAENAGFRLAVAEAAAVDDDLAAFYRDRNFASVWTGSDQVAQDRRNALLGAFANAGLHGLPVSHFDPSALIARLQAAQTSYDQGAMEVELSRLFLEYARDVQTGILDNPRAIDEGIRRVIPLRDRRQTLENFLTSEPVDYLRQLAPQTPEYARLMGAKLRLEEVIASGGWGGTVQAEKLTIGDQGPAVIDLRNRLIAMGYLPRTVTASFDASIEAAVKVFQAEHGLLQDGVAGQGTLAEINTSPEMRLRSVIVAMERERWLNKERGARHIWVNLADFTAKILDDDIVTFETRSVIGANSSDRRSPEFSDVMEYMVINPSWYVPRSIVVNEYLPELQADPTSNGQLQIIAQNGAVVGRDTDFTQFTASTFPFGMKQAPGPGNALGSVKFMFPNAYNIYLHDTPSQNLFAREVRAFSHGCIRLDDPHDFAYALLARQTSDPVGYFQSILRTGQETQVNLEVPVPVHLDYRTAFTNVDGSLQYRRDVYGRDAKIWDALERIGVAAADIQG